MHAVGIGKWPDPNYTCNRFSNPRFLDADVREGHVYVPLVPEQVIVVRQSTLVQPGSCLPVVRRIIWRGTSGADCLQRPGPTQPPEFKGKSIMKNGRILTVVAASVALLAGCTSNPYPGEQQAGKVGIYGGLGAVAGAAIGAATSSQEDRTKGALIGAAVGGLAAGGYGDRKSVV